MIRLAGTEDFASLRPDSEAAIRILALLAAYGASQPFVRYWCDGGGHAFLALLDGTVSLHADENADMDELAVFLSMQPEIEYIRTSDTSARKLADRGGWMLETGVVMTPGADLKNALLEPAKLTPRETYPLLASCFDGLSPFDSWYVDVSHRIRHGCCRIVGFRQDDIPAACAMTTSECAGAAVIGAVATRPDARGRGFASANVLTLAHQLLNEGKLVFLSPKNEDAKKLYSGLGFVEYGGWGNLRKISGKV